MRRKKLVREIVGGEPYDYVPLSKHIVSCPEVCDGNPTFKYTRIEVANVLNLLGGGWTIDRIVRDYSRPELTQEAIEEAIELASKAVIMCFAPRKAKAA